ncbi:Hypp4781 [Branchiostoma lanceolatum]|uniref:Hypp4781 protein n=1 Tax=Branchiostoma lanceolatum TaxID=7740 RepID=A0A8K0F2B2_BRALA|nr:Hypp4781 [Branchiostoma lanceolatum]
MSDVGDTILFISEEDDYSPKAEAQDSDNEDSGTQTLYTVDDIEEGLRQFERERHGEVTDQPKFPGSKGVEPISILEMVTKDAPADEKLGAPPNDTDRLYTIEDILEALETEDGHVSLKDKQEKKINLRTEESKKTVKAMRDGCRKRMKEEDRRIRKRTWRKYSLDSLDSDKMLAGLSGEKQELEKQDDKEKVSDWLPQLGGDKQEQMTESDDKKVNPVSIAERNDDRNAFLSCMIVNKAAASPVHDHESMGDVSKALSINATHSTLDDKVSVALSSQDVAIGDGFERESSTSEVFLTEKKVVIPGETAVTTSRFLCPLTEKTLRMVVQQRSHSTGCGITDVTSEDSHRYVRQAHSEYPEKKTKRAHGNGISPSTPACKLAGTSSESSNVRLTTDGVPCNDKRVTESDSHNHLTSEENDRFGHEQTTGKVNLNARGKIRRLFSGFRRIYQKQAAKSRMSAGRGKEGVNEDWTSVCCAYGLNKDTIKVLERGDCKSPILALTEDDLKTLPIPAGQRRLLNNMLEDMKTTLELTARHDNKKLAAEFRRAFPSDRYTVEAHCLEEEGSSEVLEAVTVSTADNQQDEVLIYCKPYIASLKTGTLEFDKDGDQLFDFVGEAMEMMDGDNYKGALLLLPEKTFLPRQLAEMLQQKGDIFTLRHTDRFVSDVREDVNKLLKDGEDEDEEEEEEHDKPEKNTPSGQAYLLEVSPGELVLITGDEDRREHDKVEPRTPQTKSGKSSVRSKVNRKLYPDLPESPDTRSMTTVSETIPKKKDGTHDVRSKTDKVAYDKDQTPTKSRCQCVPPASRHSKKDQTPTDGKANETTASKMSSSTATTALVSSAVHVKKDGTPDMRFRENKIAAGLHGVKLDGSPDMRFKENKQNYDASRSASFLDDTTPITTASALFQRDDWVDETASCSGFGVIEDDDGYSESFTSSFRGTYAAGPLKKDGTPDMRYKANKIAAGLYGLKMDGTPDMRFKENKTTYGSSSYEYSPGYSSGYSSGYSPSYSSGYSSSYSPSYSAGPLKKDGTPDMRYKANKIACGMYGYKKDGTPDRRFKANRR